MEQKPLTLLITGIVVGALLGFGAGYAVYNSQIADIQLRYITLSSQYQVLTTQMGTLQADYNELKTQNETLTNRYNELASANQLLQTNYNSMKSFVGVLSEDVRALNETLYTYGFLPEAFSRTLSNSEIQSQNVTFQVSRINSNEPIPLAAYGNIYAYVIEFTKTLTTNSFPYLNPSYDVFDGTRYISTFETEFHENYFKTPTETISHHEGNAVDLGTLQYAMMKNYQQNIMEGTQTIYLGILDFNDGTQGAAIFVPAANGQVTILDSAERYWTHEGTQTVSKIAASEMGIYYNHYSTQNRLITQFTLYNTNTTKDTVEKIFQGSLSEIIAFFS